MFPLGDTRQFKVFPLVTIALIITNIWVFFNELFSPNIDLFIYKYALIPQNVDFLNLETLQPFITFQFLHAGFIHLGSNMWFLWVFGKNLEATLGKIGFLFFYLFCGVIAGLIQYLFIAGTNIPMMGASGAVAGVLGAYLNLFPNHTIRTLVPIYFIPLVIGLPAGLMLFYWFFTQLFNGVAAIVVNTASVGGVAWWAHVGGFAGGWSLSAFAKSGRSSAT